MWRTVADYDIILDVLIVNQTKQVLQNFAIELHTSSDLKVVDRPQPFTVAAFGVHRATLNIKVSSTESGMCPKRRTTYRPVQPLKLIVVVVGPPSSPPPLLPSSPPP